MTSAWDRLTLSHFSPSEWLGKSYLHRLVGSLQPWRAGSWLLRWGEPLGAVLLAFLFALAPFASSSQMGVVLVALAAYWVLLTLAEDSPPSITPLHLLVLLYWAVALVAVAFSPVRAEAFSGWLKLTLYLALFALAARVLRSPRLTQGIVVAVLLAALAVSAYGIRQQLFGVEQLATWNDPTSELAGQTRVYSFLGNPNLLAAYLLPPLALSLAALFAWRRWLPKALALTAIACNGACLYFTGSRGGWIGALALMLAFLWLQYEWWKGRLPAFWRTWALPLILGALAVAAVLGVAWVEPLRLRLLSIFAGREDSSNNFRLNVWSATLDMIRDRPAIGIGPGNEAFKKVYPLYMSPKYSALSAYSIYLETAVEVGLIGLSSLLWLVVTAVSQGVRHLGRLREERDPRGFWVMAAIAGMAGLLAHGLVDTVWYRPQVSTLWWLMVAVVASQSPEGETNSR